MDKNFIQAIELKFSTASQDTRHYLVVEAMAYENNEILDSATNTLSGLSDTAFGYALIACAEEQGAEVYYESNGTVILRADSKDVLKKVESLSGDKFSYAHVDKHKALLVLERLGELTKETEWDRESRRFHNIETTEGKLN